MSHLDAQEVLAVRKPAVVGWSILAGYVVGYDLWAIVTERETLSACFWRAKSSKKFKVIVLGAWGSLTWHLLVGDKSVGGRPAVLYRKCHPIYVVQDHILVRVLSVRDAR